ncbi:hypothetical protein JCM3774_003056 [Rhodotorula dairenensis]
MATVSVATPNRSSAADASTSSSAAVHTSAPHQYAHVTFPLPEKRYVGMLHCQRDPLAASLVTRVVRCDKVTTTTTQKVATSGGGANSKAAKSKGGKAAKKGGTTSQGDAASDPTAEAGVKEDGKEEEEWELELADTVLFPEGGGQPSDTGRIVPLVQQDSMRAAAAKEAAAAVAPVVVRQVIRRNLDAVHFVSKPVEVGTEVRVEVDMDRRRDLMDQHTGQHLLSAVLEHEYRTETLSWSLQKFPELNYVELPQSLSADELAAVQRRCNDLIDEARPIRVKFELASDETGVRLGEHVPSDYKAGEHGDERPPVQRTVIIDRLDENPCCGTHYPSLAYLRTLYVSPNTTSIRGTNSRIYFAVGSSRVLAYLASVQAPARQAALEAGCGLGDLPDKVRGLVGAGSELKRRERRLHAELASWVAKDLWDRAVADAGRQTMKPVLRGSLLREEDATNSLEFLSSVAVELKQRAETFDIKKEEEEEEEEKEAHKEKKKEHVFLLASGATLGSPSGAAAGGAVLITGTDAGAIARAGTLVVETFGKDRVRGGGKGRWQGKVTGRWEIGDDLLLERIVAAATTTTTTTTTAEKEQAGPTAAA